jgi:hypothetical protein
MRPRALLAMLLAASSLGAASAQPTASASAASAVAAGAARITLKNPGFEAATRKGERCAVGWNCTMHSDPNAFRFSPTDGAAPEGARSYCVERVAPEPWALLTQASFDPALRGRAVRFSLDVRLEDVQGKGAGAWALVQGTSGRRVLHKQSLAKGTRPWERSSVEFTVPKDASLVEVGATLSGSGRMCVDDARLEVIGP